MVDLPPPHDRLVGKRGQAPFYVNGKKVPVPFFSTTFGLVRGSGQSDILSQLTVNSARAELRNHLRYPFVPFLVTGSTVQAARLTRMRDEAD